MSPLPRARLASLSLLAPILVATGCKPSQPSDPALANSVQQKLTGDGAIASEPIQASVAGGVVTLTGTVSSDAARMLASNDAGSVSGVRTVLNNLSVQTPVSAPAPVPTPEPTSSPVVPPRENRHRRDRHGNVPAPAPPPTDSVAQNTPPPGPAPIDNTPPPGPAPIDNTPAPTPAPVVRTVTLDSGTTIPVRTSQDLNSASAQQGQNFSGTVASDVVSSDGTVVLSQDSSVTGRLVQVQEAAHFKGNALLSLELTNVTRHDKPIAISSEAFNQEGKGRGKNTTEKAGIGAAAGAVLGGIFGGGKGAAIGAAAGGGSGVGINAVTRGQQADIPAETVIRFRLSTPVSVRVSSAETQSPASPRRPLTP